MRRMLQVLCGVAAMAAALAPGMSEAGTRRFCGNLVPDPGFEFGLSGFYAQGLSPTDPGPSEITHTPDNPLEGAYSVRLDSRSSGQNFWWIHDEAGTGFYFAVSAHLRSDMPSASNLQFCAMAYYADGSDPALNCTLVTSTPGDKGIVTAAVGLDQSKPLQSVRIRLYQSGVEDMQFTMDRATACLNPLVIELPTPPGVPPKVVR